jgi:hypothetical protein
VHWCVVSRSIGGSKFVCLAICVCFVTLLFAVFLGFFGVCYIRWFASASLFGLLITWLAFLASLLLGFPSSWLPFFLASLLLGFPSTHFQIVALHPLAKASKKPRRRCARCLTPRPSSSPQDRAKVCLVVMDFVFFRFFFLNLFFFVCVLSFF